MSRSLIKKHGARFLNAWRLMSPPQSPLTQALRIEDAPEAPPEPARNSLGDVKVISKLVREFLGNWLIFAESHPSEADPEDVEKTEWLDFEVAYMADVFLV